MPPGKSRGKGRKAASRSRGQRRPHAELVVITGMSGSGKGTALKALEDLGYYAVDNLPISLVPHFARLAEASPASSRAALVLDVREGERLDQLPAILRSLRDRLKVTVLYLEASDESLLRRFSETRRPHPLGKSAPVRTALAAERRRLRPLKRLADMVVDSSRFNVHELRAHIEDQFRKGTGEKAILVSCVSFGYKHGLPEDADLVFDVRFLPNPHFIERFRPLTGTHPQVARYIRSFPQTKKFIARITRLLLELLPHYVREGKSYLTIAFGCTGGQHRSVMIAEELEKRLSSAGYKVKLAHRDAPR